MISRLSARVLFQRGRVRLSSVLDGGEDSCGEKGNMNLFNLEKEIGLVKSFKIFSEATEPARLLTWQRIHLNSELKDDEWQSKIDYLKVQHAHDLDHVKSLHAQDLSIMRAAHAKAMSHQTQRYILSPC